MIDESKKRPLAEILEAMADEEEHEAAVAAVEATPPEQLRAEYEDYQRRKAARKADEPAAPAKVVPLASRRRLFGMKTTWLIAAALGAIAMVTGGIVVATRDDGILGGNRVASRACDPYQAQMTLEGTLTRTGETYALALDPRPKGIPLCGPNSELVDTLPIVTTEASPDLAPLVGQHVRCAGRIFERDAGPSPLVLEVRTVSRK